MVAWYMEKHRKTNQIPRLINMFLIKTAMHVMVVKFTAPFLDGMNLG